MNEVVKSLTFCSLKLKVDGGYELNEGVFCINDYLFEEWLAIEISRYSMQAISSIKIQHWSKRHIQYLLA